MESLLKKICRPEGSTMAGLTLIITVLTLRIPSAKAVNWIILSFLCRSDLPPLNYNSSEPFALYVLPLSKTKVRGVWYILTMSKGMFFSACLSSNELCMNFLDSRFKLGKNLLRDMSLSTKKKKKLLQRLEHLNEVTAGYSSKMILFAFKNPHIFIHFPRFICSRNSYKGYFL